MKDNFIESTKSVYNANIYLNTLGLVVQNFGNASSKINGNCLIKPSGVDYASFMVFIHYINFNVYLLYYALFFSNQFFNIWNSITF